MADQCSNCGAELFAGQQFCRRCGSAVGRAQEDAPTQLFPQGASSPDATNSGASNSGPTNSGPVNPGPIVGTSPLESGARTESVGPQPQPDTGARAAIQTGTHASSAAPKEGKKEARQPKPVEKKNDDARPPDVALRPRRVN